MQVSAGSGSQGQNKWEHPFGARSSPSQSQAGAHLKPAPGHGQLKITRLSTSAQATCLPLMRASWLPRGPLHREEPALPRGHGAFCIERTHLHRPPSAQQPGPRQVRAAGHVPGS